MSTELKRSPVLSVDIIYPIVDLLVLDYENENLDILVRDRRRSQREHHCKELLNLRVVSRAICHIVSPRLFHTLRLTHTLSSITNFLAMVQSPRVRDYVRAVRYEYWDPDPLRHEKIKLDDISERSDSVGIRQALNHALSQLHELPSLRSLSIRFGDIAPQAPEKNRIREDVSSVLDALISLSASLTRPLESLSLIRLPPIHFPQYDHPGIRSLRAHLSFFEIHTSSWEDDPMEPTPPGEEMMFTFEYFYEHILPRRLLPPPSAATGLENLESLSLCFSDPIGISYEKYRFSELHFPRLRALRLQHAQFSDAKDAETFVAQHADTLLELHLLHCEVTQARERSWDNVVVIDNDTVMMLPSLIEELCDMIPWFEIYHGFANRLGQLIYLEVDDPWWCGSQQKYAAYRGGDKGRVNILEEVLAEDTRSLEKFKQTVVDRAQKLRIEYEPVFPIRDENELICVCRPN